MEKYNFHQDQKIEYNNGFFSGIGKVVGCSSQELPIIGRTYIVEQIEPKNLPTKNYPFTHFICFESQMKLLNEKI